MKYFATIISLLITAQLPASGYFEFSADVREAYEQVTSLRFREAKFTLTQIKAREPNNLIVYHIENYLDFISLYLHQSESEYKRLKNNEEARISKLQKGDSSSPYYLYAQADVRLQWALVKLRFGDYLAAFNDISKAHKLLKKNQEKFPEFLPNKKDLGVLHALAGTVPDNYKWGVKLLSGLEGSVTQGRKELKAVFEHARQYDFVFQSETAVMYANVLLYLENDGDAAWLALQSADLEPETNPLHSFIMSNVAMRAGRNDHAIKLLQNRPDDAAFEQIPQFDFLLGLAKLRRLDPDASPYFTRFLAKFQGTAGIKEAYQKLAWSELISGNKGGYRKYMQLVLSKGKADTGGDKDALQEAKSSHSADVSLVRARLLFDGGYYQKALQQLESKTVADFPHETARLEYLYRLGRILHGLERYDEAIDFYKKAIQKGQEAPQFYACNAALQAGLILETRNDTVGARKFFDLCLRIHPEEYKTELHQKAKSGMERLK